MPRPARKQLGASRITDWLSPEFFKTKFWYMWQTTFAFQPWHSAVEFRRYLHRFMKEFTRIETLAGVKRTVFNQYDSLVRPLERWLEKQRSALPEERAPSPTSTSRMSMARSWSPALQFRRNGKTRDPSPSAPTICVFLQNASMTDASSLGSMRQAPQPLTKADSGGWALWEKLAKDHPEFGNPAAFNSSIPESVLGVVHSHAEGSALSSTRWRPSPATRPEPAGWSRSRTPAG